MDVSSTFAAKSASNFFPLIPLCRFLNARHGEMPSGHWTEMTAVILDFKTMAIAHVWRQIGVSYFVSTCGSAETHEKKCI